MSGDGSHVFKQRPLRSTRPGALGPLHLGTQVRRLGRDPHEHGLGRIESLAPPPAACVLVKFESGCREWTPVRRLALVQRRRQAAPS